MRPPLWHPPIALSMPEQTIIKRIRRAKLFVLLRQHRRDHNRLGRAKERAEGIAHRPGLFGQ